MSALIRPQWPQPASVRSYATTRKGGISLSPFGSLNLGSHVGDNPQHVAANRQRLIALGGLPAAPHWLEQVHGTDVARLTSLTPVTPTLVADAAYTCEPGVVCAAMTADCLPVLFCSRAGDEVAAAHAGWRGLCAGVLENTLACFRANPGDVLRGSARQLVRRILKWGPRFVKPLWPWILNPLALLFLPERNSWPISFSLLAYACNLRV